MFWRKNGLILILFLAFPHKGFSASGTEGASFLDIPVGAGPAALGSSYTAQANDAYAPVWNPAGLGFLHSAEFTGMHLSYISPVSYEHAGIVVPVGKSDENEMNSAGVGASIQYLGTGAIDARDETGQSIGSFKSSFAAYSLAYGQKLLETLSLGASGKIITEKISDASGSAYASDVGLLYKPTSKLSLGSVIANIGSQVKLANEPDPLPLSGRVGATYQWRPQWDFSIESVYRKTGLFSGSLGVEWRYGDLFTFRAGYNTAHTKELSPASGITAGLGLFFWGQEFSYAWVPMGDLGQTHYFSLVLRWDTKARPEHPRLKSAAKRDDDFDDSSSYRNVYDFLNENEKPIK